MFYRRYDGVISSCENRGSCNPEGLVFGGLSYRAMNKNPVTAETATLEILSQASLGDNNVCPAAGSFLPLSMILVLK